MNSKEPIKHIEVVPYNPNWPKIFESEKAIISNALGDNCVAIHHIGSTSVPGLVAKPKIDIIVEAKDRKSVVENLENAGYKHKGEWNIPLKCGFTKRDVVNVNLHVFFDKDHPEIELNLLFRDYLKTHPDVRNKYAAIKMQILQDDAAQKKVGNLLFSVYTIRKRKFIDDILEKIGFSRLRILKCLVDEEWNAAKNFRQKYFFDKRGISDPYQRTFDNKNHEHFLLYHGTKIIGYAHIQLWPESRAALRIIALFEEYRRQNFGSHFLAAIEKWLKVHDYKSLHIESSEEALNFYKKTNISKCHLTIQMDTKLIREILPLKKC